VVDEIQGAMQQVIRIFVCYEYDLLFDYAAIVDESRVGERRTRVRGLIANDAFLSAIQSVSYGLYFMQFSLLMWYSFRSRG
jgi:hypothetical protein